MNNLLNKNFISGFIFASIALTFILIVLSRFFINSNNEPSILTDTPEKAALLFFEFALKGDEKKLKRLLIEPPQDYFVECPEIISAKNDIYQTEGLYTPDLPLSNKPTGEVTHKASLYRRIKAFINPEPFENPLTEKKYYKDMQVYSDIELLWHKARTINIDANSRVKYKIIESNLYNDEASIKIVDNILNYEEYFYMKKVGEEWKIFAWQPTQTLEKTQFIFGKVRNCSNPIN